MLDEEALDIPSMRTLDAAPVAGAAIAIRFAVAVAALAADRLFFCAAQAISCIPACNACMPFTSYLLSTALCVRRAHLNSVVEPEWFTGALPSDKWVLLGPRGLALVCELPG